MPQRAPSVIPDDSAARHAALRNLGLLTAALFSMVDIKEDFLAGSLYRGDNSSLLGAGWESALVSCRLTTPQVPKQILPNWEPMQRSSFDGDARPDKSTSRRNTRRRGDATVAVNPREKCDAGERTPTRQVRRGVQSNFLPGLINRSPSFRARK